jgi:hypothetical protein
MIAVIVRTAVALILSVGLAHAQGHMPDEIDGFEGSLREQIAQACRSVHIFVYDARERIVYDVPAIPGLTSSPKRIVEFDELRKLRWAASSSEEGCIEAHEQVLANLPQARRDQMYRARYNEAIETCLRTLQMPARADACKGFASNAARRTHLRDYILKSLTGKACASLLKASGDTAWKSGFCLSFAMPSGEEEQWKTFLAKILATKAWEEKAAQPCLPLTADAILRLARAGFDCTASSAGEDQPKRCRRSFQPYDFLSLDQPDSVGPYSAAMRTIEIEGSPTGELRDVCAVEAQWIMR